MSTIYAESSREIYADDVITLCCTGRVSGRENVFGRRGERETIVSEMLGWQMGVCVCDLIDADRKRMLRLRQR